jgi:hypothetical protein
VGATRHNPVRLQEVPGELGGPTAAAVVALPVGRNQPVVGRAFLIYFDFFNFF